MRDLLKNDRARIQIGRISQFGLLEMSRQRLRPSLLESHSTICGHCQGKGTIRSIESLALQILRDIERMSITGTVKTLLAIVPSGVDLFLLNQKRDSLVEIEKRFEVSIQIDRSENLTTSEFNLEVLEEKQRSLKIVSSKNDKIEKNSKQIQEPVYKEDRAENNPEINAAEVEIDQSIVNSVSDESDFSRENNINRNKNRRRHKIRRSDVNKNVVDENTVQNENKENSEFNSVKDDENNQTIAENKTENSKDAARSDFRNQNRRRRHPYQRRHQNNRFENNGTNISSDENKSQIVDKAAVVNIRSGSNQRTQSSKKLESKEAKSSDGGEEQSDKSSKKGWLRRLLE
jgi:ribonuclease E